MDHSETVQRIYDAFGRGDIATILGYIAEDVDWEYGAVSTDVPWLQHRSGRAEVPAFFATLQALEFHAFTPTRILGSGSVVVALVDLDATVRATGQRIVEADEVHIWHFNEAGQVVCFRHRVDTHQQWAAYHG